MQAVSSGLRRSSDVARARVKSRVQKIVVAGSSDQHDRRSDRFDRFRRSISRRAIGNKARRSIATCLIINGATVDVSSQEFRSRTDFNLLTRQDEIVRRLRFLASARRNNCFFLRRYFTFQR